MSAVSNSIIQEILSFAYKNPYIVSSILLGLGIFYLYFYGTVRWAKSSWNRRIVYSLLLGLSCMCILTVISIFLTVPLTLMGLNWLASFLYVPFAIVFFVYMLYYRHIRVKQSLSSDWAKIHFHTYLFAHRTYWVWILILSSIEALLLLAAFTYTNPFIERGFISEIFWFFIAIDYFIIVGFGILVFFIIQLSFLSIDQHLFSKVLNCIFFSFNNKEVNCLKTEECSKGRWKRLHRLNGDFFAKLLLTLSLVAVLIISLLAFQVFIPSVSVIQTPKATDNNVEFFLLGNGTVLYTMAYETVFWVNLPFIPFPSITLSYPNPSNLTVEVNNVHSFSRNDLISRFKSDNSLNCTLKGDFGSSELNIEPLEGYSQTKESACVKLYYSDCLELDLVDIKTSEHPLDNESIATQMSLLINNDTPYGLFADSLPLLLTRDYGNLTSFMWFVNGKEHTDNISQVQNGFLWVPVPRGIVRPYSTTNMTISAIFGVK